MTSPTGIAQRIQSASTYNQLFEALEEPVRDLLKRNFIDQCVFQTSQHISWHCSSILSRRPDYDSLRDYCAGKMSASPRDPFGFEFEKLVFQLALKLLVTSQAIPSVFDIITKMVRNQLGIHPTRSQSEQNSQICQDFQSRADQCQSRSSASPSIPLGAQAALLPQDQRDVQALQNWLNQFSIRVSKEKVWKPLNLSWADKREIEGKLREFKALLGKGDLKRAAAFQQEIERDFRVGREESANRAKQSAIILGALLVVELGFLMAARVATAAEGTTAAKSIEGGTTVSLARIGAQSAANDNAYALAASLAAFLSFSEE